MGGGATCAGDTHIHHNMRTHTGTVSRHTCLAQRAVCPPSAPLMTGHGVMSAHATCISLSAQSHRALRPVLLYAHSAQPLLPHMPRCRAPCCHAAGRACASDRARTAHTHHHITSYRITSHGISHRRIACGIRENVKKARAGHGNAIKVACTGHSVSTGIREGQPVAIAQRWQLHVLVHHVSAVACGPPQRGGEEWNRVRQHWQLW